MIETLMLMTMLSAAPVPDPPAPGEDLKKIQGEWVVVKMAWQREPNKTTGIAACFEGEKFTIHGEKGADSYKISRMKSGEIDLIKQTRPAIGILHLGIYALEEETLKIAFEIDGQADENPPKRPTKFESPDGSPNIIYFLERRKDPKKGKREVTGYEQGTTVSAVIKENSMCRKSFRSGKRGGAGNGKRGRARLFADDLSGVKIC